MSLPAPPPAALAEIMGPSTRAYARLEIYEEDGQTLWEQNPYPGFESGSVTVDSTRDERRMLDLVLNNSDKKMRVRPGELWYDKVMKVYRGVIYTEDGVDKVWAPQVGEFMLDEPKERHFPASIPVRGVDYTKKLLDDQFYVSTTFNKGSTPEGLIRTIATNGGIKKFALANTGITTARDFVFEPQESRWSACKEIAEAYGYDLFFDALGVLVMSEYQDPLLSPVVYQFTLDENSVVVDWEKSAGQTRMYNAVVVRGDTSAGSGITVWASAENHDPNSPTSIENLGRRRVYNYTSSFITTVAQAQDVANKFLAIHSLEDFTLSLQHLVLPWIEAGEIIDFQDPEWDESDPTRFLLSSFTIPLGIGVASAEAKRVVIAG